MTFRLRRDTPSFPSAFLACCAILSTSFGGEGPRRGDDNIRYQLAERQARDRIPVKVQVRIFLLESDSKILNIIVAREKFVIQYHVFVFTSSKV